MNGVEKQRGHTRTPHQCLQSGDVLETQVERIGVRRNCVVARE